MSKKCQFSRCHEPAKWRAKVINPWTGNKGRIYACERHRRLWAPENTHRGGSIPWGSYVPDPPEI